MKVRLVLLSNCELVKEREHVRPMVSGATNGDPPWCPIQLLFRAEAWR